MVLYIRKGVGQGVADDDFAQTQHQRGQPGLLAIERLRTLDSFGQPLRVTRAGHAVVPEVPGIESFRHGKGVVQAGRERHGTDAGQAYQAQGVVQRRDLAGVPHRGAVGKGQQTCCQHRVARNQRRNFRLGCALLVECGNQFQPDVGHHRQFDRVEQIGYICHVRSSQRQGRDCAWV